MDAVADFYDNLAPEYDLMTGFEQRMVTDRPFFRLIVERYGIKRAVDAGCGTGFHSFLLAHLGVDVTAVDASSVMLQKLEARREALGLNVHALRADFATLREKLSGEYDAVFCLGNTFAHLTTEEDLREALRNFSSILSPAGILFIQIVNFKRLLVSRQRVQSVRERGEKIFVRFYDFEPKGIRFNILTLERSEGSLRHGLSSVCLRPFTSDDISGVLRRHGFDDFKFYGGISLDEFDPVKSNDLVVIAGRGRTLL